MSDDKPDHETAPAPTEGDEEAARRIVESQAPYGYFPNTTGRLKVERSVLAGIAHGRAQGEAERAALEAMLDRIAEIDGVEFDPRCEESIADGVHGLSDHAVALEAERDESHAEVRRLQGEVARERRRGDELNARNCRLERESSLLKPESMAKALMEKAYQENVAELTAARERIKALEGALASLCDNPNSDYHEMAARALLTPRGHTMSDDKRTIVTLCGSTRFYTAFQEANYSETMAGRIVLSVGFYPHSAPEAHGEERGCTPAEKAALDVLHFEKIAMSDEVLVLNVDGYVGESTRNEIALAVLLNKRLRWLDPERGGDEWLEANAHDMGRRVAEHAKAGRLP